MFKKITLYGLVFLLALACFLIAMMPARFVWEEAVAPNLDVRKLGVNVQAVEGTLWQGKALVQYKSLASVLAWDVDLLGLFSLSLPIEIDVNSQAGELLALVRPGLAGSELLIRKADIELSQINPFLRRQRVTLSGDLFIKDLVASYDGQRFDYANGVASWSGGDIAYPAQRSVHERQMPPFQVKLETQESGDIHLGIRESGGNMDVIEASLSPQGEGLVQVKRKLLDLADEHWPKNSKESDTVFKVKKMIY